MFRKMRRAKKAISDQKCIELLEQETRGVLSVLGDDDYPYGVPINHYYDKDSHKLYFHGGKIGHRVDAVLNHDKVSFCVFDKGYKEEGQWAYTVPSVIVFGRMKPVEDLELAEAMCRKLSYKFTDDTDYIEKEIQGFMQATQVFELEIEHMTGKQIREE